MPTSTDQPRICVFCSTQAGNDSSAADAALRLAQLMHENECLLVYGGGTTGLMGILARERVRLGGPETVIGVVPYGLVESERPGQGRQEFHAATVGGGNKSTLGAVSKLKHVMGISSDQNSEINQAGVKLAPEWEDAVDLPKDPKHGLVVGVSTLTWRKALMMHFVKRGGPGSGFLALPGGFGSLDEILEVLTHRQLNAHSCQMVLCNVDGFWDGLELWMSNASEKGFLGQQSRDFVRIVDKPEEAIELLMATRAQAAWRLGPRKEAS